MSAAGPIDEPYAERHQVQRRPRGRPDFLDTHLIQISIDTSGYCQARCACCVWPELAPSRRMMTVEEFSRILTRLKGFRFSEFAFNSINEPFSDKTILEKLALFIDLEMPTRSLFFSSNWLIPKPKMLDRFTNLMVSALEKGAVEAVSINATISGVDDDSYDLLQAGRQLEGVMAPYRPLKFSRAVENILDLIERLQQRVPPSGRLGVNLKAYGFEFDQLAYASFWQERLAARGIDLMWCASHVKPRTNHAFTSFARSSASSDVEVACAMRWLDNQLVIGPEGTVGLCCHEGARRVSLGSLLDQSLEEIVAGERYREQLSVVRGEQRPPAGHQCARCEHYR